MIPSCCEHLNKWSSLLGNGALTRLSNSCCEHLKLMIVSFRKGSFNKSTTSRITNVGPKPSRRWWSSEQLDQDHQKKIVNGLTGEQREFWSHGPQPTKSDGRVRLQNQHFSHNSPCSHHHHHYLLSLPPNLLQSSWFLSNVIIEESIQSRERDITSQKRVLVALYVFHKTNIEHRV